MNILLLAPQPFYQERGTPIAVRLLIQELQAAGHSIELLTFHEGEDVELGGAVVHRTMAVPGISNIGPGFSLKKIVCDFFMLLRAIALCRKRNFDVVHAVEESIYIALILKVLYKILCVYDVDSWMSDQLIEKYPSLRLFRRIFSFFEKIAVQNSDAAVVVCRALDDKVKQYDNKMPVLLLEDVSLLEDSDDSFESLPKLIGSDDRVLLYVGNLEKYQGIDLLLESFAEVQGRISEISLVIIGGSEAGIEKYGNRAEELAIESKVFFIGARPLQRLAMYLKQADLLISPRIDGENTPMKIYSYMASGTPIVATKITSHTQVLEDTTALLADPDSISMANAIATGIKERTLAAEVGLSAKAKAEKEYSRSAFRNKLTTFYTELSNVWNLRI